MTRVLLAYATKEGQTERIAARLASRIRTANDTVDVVDLGSPPMPDPAPYDSVIIGGSIHYGHYSKELRQFLRRYRVQLDRMPNAFFSVSLTARRRDAVYRKKAQRFIERLSRQTGWHPRQSASFAGALVYSRYSFLERNVLRLIERLAHGDTDASRDYEYTDWADVERFAEAFRRQIEKRPTGRT